MSTSDPTPDQADPPRDLDHILVDAPAAARLCSISRSTWLLWDASGLTPRAIRLGKRVLWSTDQIRAWAQASCPDRAEFERRLLRDRQDQGQERI